MYKVLITQGDFLTPEEFKKKYSTDEVQAFVENVEFEGTNNVHTTGYTMRKLQGTDFGSISEEIERIFRVEYLRGESLGVFNEDETDYRNEIYTEEDFDI